MGYYTTVEGEITITPPLAWNEFRNSPFNSASLDTFDGMKNIKLRINEESVETDEGQLIRRSATALVAAWGDSSKYYYLVEHVQEAIDAFPGHSFTGRLDCTGEEPGDIWRVIIRNGRATKVQPQLIWPADAEG